MIGIIESASLKKDHILVSYTGHIPFSNYPIHLIFSENNKIVWSAKSSAGRPARIFWLTEYYEICLLVYLTMKRHVHLFYKTGTLYLFPMQPDLVFLFFGGWSGWEIYLIYRILSFTGSLHPGTVQWLRGLCTVVKIMLDYDQLKIQSGTKFLPS